MNKTELIDAVAAESGLTKADADKAVNACFNLILDALSKGDQVALVGFGTFKVSVRAARTGRNPQTGAPIKIEASKVARFTPGKAVKDKLNSKK